MTRIFSVDTGLAVLPRPTGTPAAGAPAWVTVRPDVRRGAAVAADLLSALGKDLTWHGKGRNENEDIRLACAWLTTLQVTALVVTNAQEAPLATLDTLRGIAHQCDVDLWLLHRAPIDDRTHRKITKMATRPATLDQVPPPTARATRETPGVGQSVEIPSADFTTFHAALMEDPERYAAALMAYTDQLDRTGSALTAATTPRAELASAAVRALRAAPDDGELIARLRALQVLAWCQDLFLDVDATKLLCSVERPRCSGDALDAQLLAYRQPQRAVVTALTLRGVQLDDISSLTLDSVGPDGTLHGVVVNGTSTDALRLAVLAQRRLRELDGVVPSDRLFAPDSKTPARFVNDACADLGVNVAGRRVERQFDQATWLKRLGITLRSL